MYRILFPQADSVPWVVMVEPKKCKSAHIIDWDFAGRYPGYGEFTKMYGGTRSYLEMACGC